MNEFQSPAYRRARKAYIAQSVFEYFLSLIVGGAFLTKLLLHLGISDALTGIISSFITLAFVFQIFSLAIMRLRVSRKSLVLVAHGLSFFLFMGAFLTPFLPISGSARTVLVTACIMLGYIFLYLISSPLFRWANSHVAPDHRARYSALRETVSLVCGIVFSACMGWLLDRFELMGRLEQGLLFIAWTILVLNLCNFLCMLLIKKDAPQEQQDERIPIGEMLKNTLGNRQFRNVILLMVLWECAKFSSVSFVGVYYINDLGLSVLTIQFVSILGQCLRIAVSRPFGRYSDKTTFAKGFRMGLYLMAGAFFVNIFLTPSTWFLMIGYTLLYSASYAGLNMNSFNITYSYIDSKYFAQAMILKNCIGGLFGFGTVLLSGRLLSGIQQAGDRVLGLPIYGQQLLSALSFLLTVVTALFCRYVIEKQKVLKQ